MFSLRLIRNVYVPLYKSGRCISNMISVYKPRIVSNPLKKPTFYVNNRCVVICNAKRINHDRDNNLSKTFIYFKYLRLIKRAVREFGPIIEENPKLVHVIQNAQKNNLPSEYIDFALKISCEVRATVGLFDLLLSNGCHLVIQYEDIDTTVTRHHLLELCGRFDFALMQRETNWPQSFDQKGIISVKHTESDNITLGEDFVSSIKAETVLEETDVDGVKYWKFYCEPWLLHEVRENLHKITDNIEEAYVGYVPRKKIMIHPSTTNYVCDIITELCKVPTIDNVYHNIKLADQ